MDAEILHALWFDCHDLSDIQRTLLQALAYHCHHGNSCYPSVRRLALMIRRTHRQTQTLLRQLEKAGYITIIVRRGRGHSNLYTINMKPRLHISGKIRSLDFISKYEAQTSPELLKEEEKNKEETPEELLLRLGLTPGSGVWIASLNGHQK
jgi:MarR-like DNA-binding transcriptional regulator SgrR of sgrS sRNA